MALSSARMASSSLLVTDGVLVAGAKNFIAAAAEPTGRARRRPGAALLVPPAPCGVRYVRGKRRGAEMPWVVLDANERQTTNRSAIASKFLGRVCGRSTPAGEKEN